MSKLYPERNCLHRNMGPPEAFPCCSGTGRCYREDPSLPLESFFGETPSPALREAYCDCEAGRERMRIENEPS